MSVYVDDMEAQFGRMAMCHMIADTRAELFEMADKIGVQRKWIQCKDTYKEHFDICKSKRALAIAHGATPLTMRNLNMKLNVRRDRARQDPGVVNFYKGVTA